MINQSAQTKQQSLSSSFLMLIAMRNSILIRNLLASQS
jgi:hypothetical protein